MSQTLQSISEKLLSESISIPELKSTLTAYKGLLQNSTSLNLSRIENKTGLKLENGIAIGLTWAASCLDDSIRTRKFVRGTKLAIDQKLLTSGKPVHLLYAGTGPFATLILPLLSHYSKEQLQVTLLDVNPASIENVTKIIQHFGFEDQVREIRCADATKIILKDALNFDILLSETMQHALQRELQVVITAHLLNQMPSEAILIPRSIELELITKDLQNQTKEPSEIFGEIMKVDANFLRSQYPIDASWEYEKEFNLPIFNSSDSSMLAISTKIVVFGNEIIELNQSGLTVPQFIAPLRDLQNKESISLKYVIDPEPSWISPDC